MLNKCDENGNIIGSISRTDVHMTGDWHQAIHIYLINKKSQILMQLRAKNKDIAPDVWDISVGGHIDFGENSVSTARRELEEELGISSSEDEFEYLFTYKEILKSSNYISREFVDVYLIEKDVTENDIILQKAEVIEFEFVPVEDFINNVKNKVDKFNFHEDEYLRVIPILEERYIKK